MKKLFCVLLCLLLTATALVGCGDVDRNKWLGEGVDEDGKIIGGNYDGESTVVAVYEVSLNLYIIVDDETCDEKNGVTIVSDKQGKLGEVTQATNTVSSLVKEYTSSTYNTLLNVVFVKESDYENVVMEAVNATDAKAANIVLVNSYSLMQKLYATNKLLPLGSYLDTNKYGQLNTNIPESLIEASKLDGEIYSIPNNHAIGNYEYLLIDKLIAREYKISDTEAKAFTSYDEVVERIGGKAELDKFNGEAIALVSGSYEDKRMYEDQGYFCNVVKMPVADKNEAFLSAFAIVDRNAGEKADVNDRAMEIVYDLNMKVELRNLLQYGAQDTNYTINDDNTVQMMDYGPNFYRMNLIYTGNINKAFFCDELGWTEVAKENAIKQNADSVTLK